VTLTQHGLNQHSRTPDGQCEAYTRLQTRCRIDGWFDNYHFAVLCDTHADMLEPPMTAEMARVQRQERDNRLHNAWRNRQAS
jgi:hypothetical protein